MRQPLLELGEGSTPVAVSAPLVIGRAPGCAVRIDADGVSPQHAQLLPDGAGAVFIRDLGSFAGTLRNGDFVYGQQRLEHGDEIQIGPATLRFRAHDGPLPARPRKEDSTRRSEMPDEVRRAQLTSLSTATRPVVVPSGVMVGTPDGSEDQRTQMVDMSGVEGWTRNRTTTPPPLPQPPRAEPAPLPPPPKPQQTVMGLPSVPPPRPAPPPVGPAPPPRPAPPPVAPAPPQRTVMGLPAVPPPPQAGLDRLDSEATIDGPPSLREPSGEAALPSLQTVMSPPPAGMPVRTVMGLHPVSPSAPPLATQPGVPGPLLPDLKTVVSDRPAAPPVAPPQPITQPMAPVPLRPDDIHGTTTAPSGLPAVAGSIGPLAPFRRALAFVRQVLALARLEPALLKPLWLDLAIATPLSLVLALALGSVRSPALGWTVLGAGTALLYLVDFACNGLTVSLMYDYVTARTVRLDEARARVRKALPHLVLFAGLSALFDLVATYGRERDDLVSRVLLRLLRAVWTTATYVILPALVVEGVPFGSAFARGRALMARDPTGVGAGIVALSLASYGVAAIVFPLAWVCLRWGSLLHPAVGAIGFFLLVSLYWALSGWLKAAYVACFYEWARACEAAEEPDPQLAPPPLRAALMA